jgi:hypothetical protein
VKLNGKSEVSNMKFRKILERLTAPLTRLHYYNYYNGDYNIIIILFIIVV